MRKKESRQDDISNSITIYKDIDEGECLNRLVRSLKLIEQKILPQLPTLIYGAVDLRYAIEGTIKRHAYMLSGRYLKSFSSKWMIKDLKTTLLKHDKQFFSKQYVCVMIAKYELGIDLIDPDFEMLDKILGRSSKYVHAPHKFMNDDDFESWIATFEESMRYWCKYMCDVFGGPKPKRLLFKRILNEKGLWLADRHYNRKMNEKQIIEFIKNG